MHELVENRAGYVSKTAAFGDVLSNGHVGTIPESPDTTEARQECWHVTIRACEKHVLHCYYWVTHIIVACHYSSNALHRSTVPCFLRFVTLIHTSNEVHLFSTNPNDCSLCHFQLSENSQPEQDYQEGYDC